MSEDTDTPTPVEETHDVSEVANPSEIEGKVKGKNPYVLIHESPGLRVRAINYKGGVIVLTESYDLAAQVNVPNATLRAVGNGLFEIVE